MQSFAHLHKTDQKIHKDIHHNKAFYCMCVRADTANASWTHLNMYDETFAHVDIVYQRDDRYRYCYPGDPSSLWHIETTWCLRFWVGAIAHFFFEFCIVGHHGTGTLWDLWNWYVAMFRGLVFIRQRIICVTRGTSWDGIQLRNEYCVSKC